MSDTPNANASLLDAPADNQGADGKQDAGSLLDAKPEGTQGSQPDGKSPSGDQPGKTPPADSKDAKPDNTTVSGAPEKYADFKAPEGVALNAEAVAKFDAECKALNLPQEKRDAILGIAAEHTKNEIDKTMTAFNETIQNWAQETKKNLGASPEKQIAVASKAIDTIFADPKENKEFREMMKDSGLGNWWLMVKAFSFVGKALSEDKFVEGRPDSKQEKTVAERMYPDLAPK